MDDYGKFVNNYVTYTETPNGMEYELGRKPALDALGAITGKKILELGPGPGVNGPELSARGAKVIGIDVSEEELVVARQRDPDNSYIHYDGIHLAEAIDHQPVDSILASFSVCTISDEKLKPILRDMRQLLVPGGRFVIVEPNLEKALGMRYHDLHYHAQPGVKSGDHVKVTLGTGESAETLYHDIYRTHADYRRLLREAGFTITKMFQPRPRGRQILNWWKAALVVPPFTVIIAEQ